LTRNRPVSRDLAGSCGHVWVKELLGHNGSAHRNRRLRTHTRSGTSPCGRSLTRQVGRSLTSEDSTPPRRAPTLGLGALDQHHPTPLGVPGDVQNPVPGQRKQQGRTVRHSSWPLPAGVWQNHQHAEATSLTS